ncbi:DNA-processing protein DprA [Nocardia gipuzkoensis]
MSSTAHQIGYEPTEDPHRLAWALLSVAACGPSAALWRLVASHGVTETAAALAHKTAAHVDRSILQRAVTGHAARLLASHYAAGGRLVTPDDDEWPTALLTSHPIRQQDSDPAASHRSATCVPTVPASRRPGGNFVAPLALWVRGEPSLRELACGAIAVVGTALATDYDIIDATVEHLHRQGWGICSTGAFGTGIRALSTSLRVGAPTLIIQPSGANHPHPHQHRELFDNQLATGGLIVSAYPPDARFEGLRKDYRAQLVAALSRATVLIASPHRGSAFITAQWARQLSRPVFTYPGPDTDTAARGSNQMIRDRTATPLSSPADITITSSGNRSTSTNTTTAAQAPAGDNSPSESPDRDAPTPGTPAQGEGFRVSWTVEITAENPRAAAREARRLQRTPAMMATVFDVRDAHGTTHRIDLCEEDDPPTDPPR